MRVHKPILYGLIVLLFVAMLYTSGTTSVAPLRADSATDTATPTEITGTDAATWVATDSLSGDLATPDTSLGGTANALLFTLTSVAPPKSSLPTVTPGYQTAIVKDGLPHFIDFNAVWCAPCNAMRPSIMKLKIKYAGKITFDSFDIDQDASFNVMAAWYPIGTIIPYMVLTDKNLKIVKRLDAEFTQADLDNELSQLLDPSQLP